MTEELSWLDEVERVQMPLGERLLHHERRYLIEGRRPVGAPAEGG